MDGSVESIRFFFFFWKILVKYREARTNRVSIVRIENVLAVYFCSSVRFPIPISIRSQRSNAVGPPEVSVYMSTPTTCRRPSRPLHVLRFAVFRRTHHVRVLIYIFRSKYIYIFRFCAYSFPVIGTFPLTNIDRSACTSSGRKYHRPPSNASS